MVGLRHGGIVGLMVVETSERTGTWDLAEGEELAPGRYAVRRLGVSNIHEVYVAWDEGLLGLVAAKVLRRDRLRDREALKALANEAALLGSLQHPSLPRCFDACLDAERPHLALELIEGPRVSTVIRRQRILAVEQVIPLALQICSVLHYIAGQGLVHLDIKPKNVIMAPPPRVIDLSIARTIADARRTHGPIGTDPYMAPEQCGGGRAERMGPPTDIWGLGVTLYESLAGRRPFPAGEPNDRLDRRFPQLRMEPDALPTDVPATLRPVIDAALQRRPEDRPTAAEIVDMLGPLSEMTPPRLLLGRVRVTAWRTPGTH
jgi:serine/threonine protein kinase